MARLEPPVISSTCPYRISGTNLEVRVLIPPLLLDITEVCLASTLLKALALHEASQPRLIYSTDSRPVVIILLPPLWGVFHVALVIPVLSTYYALF